MTQATTLKASQQDVQRLTTLRQVIKELVQKQKAAKLAKSTVTSTTELADLQSQIALQRQAISTHSEELQAIRARLSQIPYGLNNTASKVAQVSQQIDQVKESYQIIVVKQRDLKKSIQASKFVTVESLSDAQKEKASNVKTINALTAKRFTLKQKYKALSDVVFNEQQAA